MTVCIASICDSNIIFGASDRMMTSGDIEFEPRNDVERAVGIPENLRQQLTANRKIWGVTSSVVIMTAGDSGLQGELLQDVTVAVKNALEKEKDHPRWLSVKEITNMYVAAYNRAKAMRAHQAIFEPFGLTPQSFLDQSSVLANHIVVELTKQVQRFESVFTNTYPVEAIIVGIDDATWANTPTAHIYSVVKSCGQDSITCCDAVGFAAIGIGARHAESQFMLAGHSPFSSSQETILLTYLAKKRSEVAPGVGEGTDMFSMGPGLGSLVMLDKIPDFDLKKIESIYNDVEKSQKRALQNGMKKSKNYLDAIFKERAAKQQQPNPVAPENPPI